MHKIPWKQIEQLQPDVETSIAGWTCKLVSRTRFEVEHMIAFQPENDETLYRRIRNPNGNWSNTQELANRY